MGRVGKYVFLLATVLFVLCISKRIDASELAVKFIFPNFAGIAYQKEEKLPITSEIEDTKVEGEVLRGKNISQEDAELRNLLAEKSTQQ